jgi:hypothetical protein
MERGPVPFIASASERLGDLVTITRKLSPARIAALNASSGV